MAPTFGLSATASFIGSATDILHFPISKLTGAKISSNENSFITSEPTTPRCAPPNATKLATSKLRTIIIKIFF